MKCPLLLGHTRAPKKTSNTEILVDLGPMDAKAIAEKFEVAPLGLSGVQQPRKPGDGDGETAAIGEQNDQLVFGHLNFLGAGMCFNA